VECGVVLLWHGLWSLIDITTKGEEWLELSHAHSALLSLVLGWGGGAALFLSQFSLLRLNTQHSPAFLLLFWLFLLAGAAATISSFRGVWNLLDVTLGNTLSSQVAGLAGGLAVLATTRTLSCLHAGVFSDSPAAGLTITFHYCTYWWLARHRVRPSLPPTPCPL